MTRAGAAWRLLLDGPGAPDWNMAVDEALARACGAGQSPPTLRLYRWEPPAVSIGYAQSLASEVDLAACAALGVGWVRRPTGGRAVLHQDEVTYAVALAEDGLPGGVLESYRHIGVGLLAGLRRLGVPVDWASPESGTASAACFAVPSQYEIAVNGRKLVGSAQTRRWGAVLQHGSVLIRLDRERLVRLLRPAAGEDAAGLLRSLREHATALDEVLEAAPSPQAVARALADGFAEALELDLEPGGLSAAERQASAALVAGKYSTAAWNEAR